MSQPLQQPSDPQEPRTQSIPVVTPDSVPATAVQPAVTPDPGPQSGWSPTAMPAPPPPLQAAPPQAASAPPASPQAAPAPPPPSWPQPVASQPTGPVDFVPGFGTPTGPSPGGRPAGSTAAPGSGDTASGGPAGAGARKMGLGARLGGGLHTGSAPSRTALAGLGLCGVGFVLLELGLALGFGDRSLWSVVPIWSAFATLATLIALLPLALPLAGRAGLPVHTGWRIGAAGVAGLAVFWVLVALPLAQSDRGFLLTAALALAGAAVWLAPGRTE